MLKIKHLFCSVQFYQNILQVLENDFANTFILLFGIFMTVVWKSLHT